MSAERPLQLLTALLMSLGSVMLGVSSGNVTLPLLTITASATSIYLTDRLRWFYLHGAVANLAALCAALIAVYDFYDLERDRQLLAIAYLLVYLQIVLLFQLKTDRIYWQLHLLSLLQVIVATAISRSLGFGLLLFIYLFCSLWTGFVFFVFRQNTRQRARRNSLRPETWTDEVSLEAALGERKTRFHPRLALAAMRQATGICLFALLTFLLLPRFGDGTSNQSLRGVRMVGFTDSVRLGELGTAIESEEPVLRLWFFSPDDDRPFRLIGSPMLRGAVVNYYRNGTWSIAQARNIWEQEIQIPVASNATVRQRIAMKPLRERTVFSIYPPVRVDPQPPVAFNLRTQQLVRTASQSKPFDVVLGTTGIRSRRQTRITAVGPTDAIGDVSLLQPFHREQSTKRAGHRLAPLQILAKNILEEAALTDATTAEKAIAICNYLKTSPQFNYSLDGVERDPKIDPIVDFLTENPSGHCEYFSSALTLMLRSVGIRARMIIGFHGGDWNHLGAYYQIRQKDAHSWTEAYIPSEEMGTDSGKVASTVGDPYAPSTPNRGGWLRLDPTPSNPAFERTTDRNAAWDLISQIRNYADFLWTQYVVQLDAERQQQEIYKTVALWARGLFEAVNLPGLSHKKTEQAAAELGHFESDPKTVNGEKTFDARQLILWLVVLVGLCVGVLLLRRLYRAGLLSGQGSPDHRFAPLPRPFFRQWERLTSRYLAERRPEQTARAHAEQMAEQLLICGLTDQHHVPARVVDAHYAYCYGGVAPPAEVEAELSALIRGLGKALASRARDALQT